MLHMPAARWLHDFLGRATGEVATTSKWVVMHVVPGIAAVVLLLAATITYKSTTHAHPICGQSDYPASTDYVGVIGVHSTILP